MPRGRTRETKVIIDKKICIATPLEISRAFASDRNEKIFKKNCFPFAPFFTLPLDRDELSIKLLIVGVKCSKKTVNAMGWKGGGARCNSAAS